MADHHLLILPSGPLLPGLLRGAAVAVPLRASGHLAPPALGDMTGATVHLAGSWAADSASADGAEPVQ